MLTVQQFCMAPMAVLDTSSTVEPPLQIGLKLATIRESSSSSSISVQLLDEKDEDMLLSWVALVLITAEEVMLCVLCVLCVLPCL